MRTNNTALKRIKIFTAIFFVAVMAALLVLPAAASAVEEGVTVRVGWHEAPYFITDQYGRHSGYTYEYQRKIAAYTGWKYEYVEASWSELLRMIKTGEIDMLGNVSYMEERAKEMMYASLPMGTESYYLFVSPDNTEITTENYSSLNGKRVGVAKDSIQASLFREWAEAQGVSVELVEMTTSEEESLLLLGSGLDAFVTMDVHGNPETAVPVWKIASSDYYFAVSKKRPDLLAELNAAMSSIQDENKYYNQQLHEKYLLNNDTKLYLNTSERDWLSSHGTIRVGYQDNYLAFCAKDELTGELIGALKDYLDYASTGMKNAELTFETKAYPTAAAALEALQKGEIDCMFPYNLSDSDSEKLGLVMTPPIMRTEMDAVVRASEQKEFIKQEKVIVAVNEGNTNYEMFLLDNFPGWEVKYFADTPSGLDGIAAGEADCVVISNYRFSNIAKQCEKLHLSIVYTGVDMDYCLAVREGETALYSILSKVTDIVPDSIVHAALTYYSTEDAKTSFLDVIKDNFLIILLVIIAVMIVILVLAFSSIRAQRKAMEEERLVTALNKRVYVDALTSVRNKGAFNDYVQELQERVDSGETLDFAIGVFDCDDLKTVNDRFGHDKGDIYLKTASKLICRVFQHSPVFRIGGDEFAVILMNEDYYNREELINRFLDEQKKICSSTDNCWEQVRVALGIAVYDPGIDSAVSDTSRRADRVMYENKRIGKQNR